MRRFETCKALRRQILRYIQHVESEELLGSLLHVNEELVDALIAFEVLDKSVDDDSDSEGEWEEGGGGGKEVQEGLGALSLHSSSPAQPPRPTSIPMPASLARSEEPEEEDEEEEEDEDDPFADRNAVSTPKVEKAGMTW